MNELFVPEYDKIRLDVDKSKWPPDFVQLLQDLMPHEFNLDNVVVEMANVEDHLAELLDVREDSWVEDDYFRAGEYAASMRHGDVFPPLIIDCPRGLLRDGYHRLCAYHRLNVKRVPAIYLQHQAVPY